MKLARSHVLIGIDEASLLAGAKEVEEELIKAIAEQGLSEEIRVVETGNLGVVGHGVLIVVYPEGVTYADVTVDDVSEIVTEHLLKGRPVKRLQISLRLAKEGAGARTGLTREQPRIVLQNCGVIDPESLEEGIAGGAYQGLEKLLTEGISPQGVIDEVTQSGLRGRGGAGFPTGKKWSFTAPGKEKYLVCNADEGEPGTFKDRLILEGDPHRLIEGMILAGYAIGATKGYVYIRGEYTLSIRRMAKAIEQARDETFLGESILGSDISFDIEIKKGAGAYVCGEETALIESIEGKRGFPRLKPPYPGAVGLWGKPTVVNNVETLANIPSIIFNGAEWFRSFGTKTCPGTKVYAILGHAATPGLIEVEMGTSLREIVYDYGGGVRDGKRFKAALIGGAAGAFVDEAGLDVAMDFDSLAEYAAVLGSGAILVLDEDASIVELMEGILHFFAHESCGQCAPCRIGTDRLVAILERIRAREGSEADLDLLLNVAETMRETSLCPLGQSPIIPIESALRGFKEEFLECVRGRCGSRA
jgi:NADH:ubiquinone oxidoreductase subunit F (NADH-binding)/(2Fe-2S) ferredoxin